MPEKKTSRKAKPHERYTREDLRRDLMRGLITEPLLSAIHKSPNETFDIIIALNETYPEGQEAARQLCLDGLRALSPPATIKPGGVNYIFAALKGKQIRELAERYREWSGGQEARRRNPVYRVWADQDIHPCVNRSAATIKADAAQRAFNAAGEGICWAVLDSGIDGSHPHFLTHGTIETRWNEDFTGEGNPFKDDYGHGTHVAGIIAGAWKPDAPAAVCAVEMLIGGSTQDKVESEARLQELGAIAGIAPKAKLVSMKVLDARGAGKASSVLRALERIQEINQYGRRLPMRDSSIHGVNLSLGYDFNPRWFACGQSPICVEVNRLVRSGVVVVVAAGNSGFSALSRTAQGTNELGYRDLSINDPGNAELAITVGSTHREMPHTYGVSYFSSRGPTGDGRLKPDLVAPGERIVSCAAGAIKSGFIGKLAGEAQVLYVEQSGTSMAAPHVSGAIAAFLSVRPEFIGEPEKVKRLFLQNTIDLNRERTFQGNGLLDLLKVLQAV